MVQLRKLHGLGNDFLVLLGTAASTANIGSDKAVRWCDRHRGIGADGLIIGMPDSGQADLVMTLFNADGSRAEISGNGIRCLAHAELYRRGQSQADLAISTDGGLRAVAVHVADVDDMSIASARVAMGPVTQGPEIIDVVGSAGGLARPIKAISGEIGNPHLILLFDDLSAVDIAVAGPAWEAGYPRGINVHAIALAPDGSIDMLVWERGVGVTEACGSGATVAAHSANKWGIAGEHVRVNMPGGTVEVTVGDDNFLAGASENIALIEVDP